MSSSTEDWVIGKNNLAQTICLRTHPLKEIRIPESRKRERGRGGRGGGGKVEEMQQLKRGTEAIHHLTSSRTVMIERLSGSMFQSKRNRELLGHIRGWCTSSSGEETKRGEGKGEGGKTIRRSKIIRSPEPLVATRFSLSGLHVT
jgi:hypothetical protein